MFWLLQHPFLWPPDLQLAVLRSTQNTAHHSYAFTIYHFPFTLSLTFPPSTSLTEAACLQFQGLFQVSRFLSLSLLKLLHTHPLVFFITCLLSDKSLNVSSTFPRTLPYFQIIFLQTMIFHIRTMLVQQLIWGPSPFTWLKVQLLWGHGTGTHKGFNHAY